ncbi:MAG: tryptophan--tRNA ligase [Candidatus Omnitrophica bacterium]|nr:tryptophan--tRNA ligase [Candidatus Omnitrophota bacterium]
MEKKAFLLSGMRPTGPLHLGHLVGVLENWVRLQDEYICFFMVADWHALMSEYTKPQIIKDYVLDNVLDWLSIGISPQKSIIFRQSEVKEHLELAMLFSIIIPLSWLERCPTYKEQMQELKNKDVSSYAFLGYPVLQAADILLYKAEFVPIGEDQLPHLEIAREIVRRFRHLYKKDIFPLPQPLLTSQSRLRGIDNRKMSKSYNNFIALTDSEKLIKQKVISMITDPKKIKKHDPGRPSICNVYDYHKIFTREEIQYRIEQINQDCRTGALGCVECKSMLADKLIRYLDNLQQKRKKYDSDMVLEILKKGKELAQERADKTMQEVKSILGLL